MKSSGRTTPERKSRLGSRASAALRTPQLMLLERALSALSDIVIVTKEDLISELGPRIVYVNDAFERRLGYSAEEAIGRSPLFLQGPAVERTPLDQMRRELSSHAPARTEVVNYTKSGEMVHLELEIIPIFDEEGCCTHYVSIERNISERRDAEAALRLSEERFRFVSRVTNDAVWEWDIEHDRVSWGDGFLELFGAGPAGALTPADQWTPRIHPDDRVAVAEGVALSIKRGDPAWHSEFRFQHENGEYLWVSARGYILRNAHGRAFRVIGAMSDITAAREDAERLTLLAAALDSVASPVVIMRLDGRIRWVNQAFAELSGYSWSESVGAHAATLLLPPSVSTAPYDELWRTLLRGEAWSGEVTNERKDGTDYPSVVTITPVRDADNQIRHFVALARDLTASRQHEAHMLRTQRAESIGTLASGIAHDLNNVLSPIVLSVDYLRETETDSDRLDALLQMELSARRGAALLRQLLLFARGMDGQRMPLNARECVEEVAAIARNTFPRNITLTVQAEDAACTLVADPTQLHQVLMNLCVNARDAMPEGGKLTVEVECRTVDDVFVQMYPLASQGYYTVFRVVDTGAGMTADVQAKLFEPFFTTKAMSGGTGLGLSTAFAIVQSHGGFIQITSEVGKGSDFRVFFPSDVQSAAPKVKAPAPSSIERGHGELVLVVDDEASIRMVATKALESFGYRVVTAENGADAVAQYARLGSEVAVVLLDMIMPILDGPATISALRALDPSVRIIASSGVSSSRYMSQVARAGVTHVAHKPYTAIGLLATIAECLHAEQHSECSPPDLSLAHRGN